MLLPHHCFWKSAVPYSASPLLPGVFINHWELWTLMTTAAIINLSLSYKTAAGPLCFLILFSGSVPNTPLPTRQRVGSGKYLLTRQWMSRYHSLQSELLSGVKTVGRTIQVDIEKRNYYFALYNIGCLATKPSQFQRSHRICCFLSTKEISLLRGTSCLAFFFNQLPFA